MVNVESKEFIDTIHKTMSSNEYKEGISVLNSVGYNINELSKLFYEKFVAKTVNITKESAKAGKKGPKAFEKHFKKKVFPIFQSLVNNNEDLEEVCKFISEEECLQNAMIIYLIVHSLVLKDKKLIDPAVKIILMSVFRKSVENSLNLEGKDTV